MKNFISEKIWVWAACQEFWVLNRLFFPVGSTHFLLETSTFVCISWNKSLTCLTPIHLECLKKRDMLVMLSPIVITSYQPYLNITSNTSKSFSQCYSQNTICYSKCLSITAQSYTSPMEKVIWDITEPHKNMGWLLITWNLPVIFPTGIQIWIHSLSCLSIPLLQVIRQLGCSQHDHGGHRWPYPWDSGIVTSTYKTGMMQFRTCMHLKLVSHWKTVTADLGIFVLH